MCLFDGKEWVHEEKICLEPAENYAMVTTCN